VTQKRIEIIQQKELCQNNFLRVDEVHLRYELYNGGMSDELIRYNVDRGNGVAIVLYDPAADSVLLVEQFRLAAQEQDAGWILELPAGIVRADEDPADAIRREVEEEVGYRLSNLKPISTFYVSPGISNERIFLFYSEIKAEERVSAGGGLPAEAEDIKIFNVTFAEIKDKIIAGKVVDAKTLIGLQWLWILKSNT
jgi:nudix-type nucleoside diphosphatase (YffH/AdpP family)